ncbi:nucleotide sugar dehydrogenase [Sphingomonas histidinilytica]|jgi:UDPglucose 6-dehydrogenase|uniref:UDP-glucose 6-dehydrogenase n=1 Tax=Rhizorhabdus histidinilytica TaxID=439228 RepID=A0A1T5CKI2_9SPHN|nr:UDP-glucose/GDP-mannose dehydrogenase family protein [Rhizorhabdus histidinilytica]MBO9378338.1 nucleotide sugar dehydrogenase [Rhizorhabdus histidinilytica]QEH78910.1 UDP-glucose/GDP-mannose dehydrogenase family protein [Sphingomonas sp. C8-2]SKB59914.1 UDP-glucose dehydrogenase [Rhizorhabdus histidinilytica]
MRLTIIGTGYVGIVSAACFSEFGHVVTCVDIDANRIAEYNAGHVPIFEPGLGDLINRNVKGDRLSFTTDLAEGVKDAEAVFIAVGTPSRRGDGHADLSYVFAAVRDLAKLVPEGCVIVNKSTVPVGTASEVEAILAEVVPGKTVHVVSNPEFLREGSAIEDFLRPDRVVVGVSSESARKVMAEIYRPLFLRETPILFTDCRTAEVIKYAANAFLSVKIAFINEIADLCETVGADVKGVAKGIGMDRRIGNKFLNPGPGYGGSCFPKDTLALLRTAEQANAKLRIVQATVDANDDRKKEMARRVIAACGGSVEGKTIGILGLTFKPNTDDMRDAPSLVVIPELQKAGAKVRAYDPEGRPAAEKMLPDVEFVSNAYQAVEDAAAVVLLTEWNEFRALNLDRVRGLLRNPLFIDLRNVYEPEDMARAGFHYISIGRSPAGPKEAVARPAAVTAA